MREMSKELLRFSDLLGHILYSVINKDNRELVFTLDTGEKYRLFHVQDCCEDVFIEDIVGDLVDLIDSPVLMAEEVSNHEYEDVDTSGTWTFYKLATVRGYVTVRWYGESNGYYSESVDWERVK